MVQEGSGMPGSSPQDSPTGVEVSEKDMVRHSII
jgi:hypothetical protein